MEFEILDHPVNHERPPSHRPKTRHRGGDRPDQATYIPEQEDG